MDVNGFCAGICPHHATESQDGTMMMKRYCLGGRQMRRGIDNWFVEIKRGNEAWREVGER